MRLIGNVIRNKTWASFADSLEDRLRYFDVRSATEQDESPLELFGFNVKVPQSYYEQASTASEYMQATLNQSNDDYTYYEGNYTAVTATASTDDDKTYALSNFTSYNSAAYAALAEIDINGALNYDRWPRTKWQMDVNAMTYLRALTQM